jgi:phosphatidylserine/phosphatidylglycerophosphate/cardiolipin synthase-like enzyme
MLIDPLGENPIVVVGSANFSKASTDTNDENMLVIRGNQAVADIYMGEFMRLFSHYAFRESLSFRKGLSQTGALIRRPLIESPRWIDGEKLGQGYFEKGTDPTAILFGAITACVKKLRVPPWWKSRRIGAEIMPDRRAREANRDRLDKQAE